MSRQLFACITGIAFLAAHLAAWGVSLADEAPSGGEASAHGGQDASHYALPDLVEQGLEESPQLLSAFEKWEAAKASVLRSWDLENPQFSYNIMGEMLETRIGPQEQMFGLSQAVPFPSKLPLRTEVAKIGEKVAAHFVLHTRQSVRSRIVKAYAGLLSAQRQLEVLKEQKGLFNQISSRISAGVASGEMTARDAARAEAEIAGVSERILRMTQMRVEAEEGLNAALGARARSVWPLLDQPELPVLSFDLDRLKALALEHRHMLVINRLLVDQEDTRLKLAQMEYLPDFEIGFDYVAIGGGMTTDPDDGRDAWMVPVTVSVPFWEPQLRGGVQEAEHAKRSVERDLEQMELETVSEISGSYARYTTARERVAIYEKSWIPHAEQGLRSARAGFEGGEEDLITVLDTARLALEARMGYWQSFSDTLSGFAEVEEVVGFPLDEIQEIESHKAEGAASHEAHLKRLGMRKDKENRT